MERSPSLPVYSPVALINLSESPCVWDSIDFPATIKSCSWIRGLLHMERDFFPEAIRNFSSRAFPHICIFRERQALLVKGAPIF